MKTRNILVVKREILVADCSIIRISYGRVYVIKCRSGVVKKGEIYTWKKFYEIIGDVKVLEISTGEALKLDIEYKENKMRWWVENVY